MRCSKTFFLFMAAGILSVYLLTLRSWKEGEQNGSVSHPAKATQSNPSTVDEGIKKPQIGRTHTTAQPMEVTYYSVLPDNPFECERPKNLEIIEDFIKKNPHDSLAKELAQIGIEDGDLNTIIESLYENQDQAVRYQCIRLAQTLFVGNDTESAREVLDMILEREPLNIDAIRSYSLVFDGHGDSEGYASFLNSKIWEHPESVELRQLLADYYATQGNVGQAVQTIEEAQVYNPSNNYYLYILGYYSVIENNPPFEVQQEEGNEDIFNVQDGAVTHINSQ